MDNLSFFIYNIMTRFTNLLYNEDQHCVEYTIYSDVKQYKSVAVYTLQDYVQNNEALNSYDFEFEIMLEHSGYLNLPENYKYGNDILVLEITFMDEGSITSTIIPEKVIYDKSICHLSNLPSRCEIPKKFIDYILVVEYIYRFKDYNYPRLLKYWNYIMGNTESNNNCNG